MYRNLTLTVDLVGPVETVIETIAHVTKIQTFAPVTPREERMTIWYNKRSYLSSRCTEFVTVVVW